MGPIRTTFQPIFPLIGPINYDLEDYLTSHHSGFDLQVGSWHPFILFWPDSDLERDHIVSMGEKIDDIVARRRRRGVFAKVFFASLAIASYPTQDFFALIKF